MSERMASLSLFILFALILSLVLALGFFIFLGFYSSFLGITSPFFPLFLAYCWAVASFSFGVYHVQRFYP